MSITLTLLHTVTDDELLELSERNPGYQFERSAKGELIVTPTGSESAHQEAELARQLGNWAQQDGRGLVFSSAGGFRLPDGTLHAPDASWVNRGRWSTLPREQRRKFAPLCPDAVFEIRLEDQTAADLEEKMRIYLANGAQIAVLIDSYDRIVKVWRPEREPEVHGDPKTVTLDPELPGFILDLEPIFAT
jgi:Uma2 family endonuclease